MEYRSTRTVVLSVTVAQTEEFAAEVAVTTAVVTVPLRASAGT